MKSIRDWAADRYRRLKAFARRQAPYLILLSFLLAFFVIFFFNKMVISIHPGELGVLWRRLGGGTHFAGLLLGRCDHHVDPTCRAAGTPAPAARTTAPRPASPRSPRTRKPRGPARVPPGLATRS